VAWLVVVAGEVAIFPDDPQAAKKRSDVVRRAGASQRWSRRDIHSPQTYIDVEGCAL
jgi:hypothetical protein